MCIDWVLHYRYVLILNTIEYEYPSIYSWYIFLVCIHHNSAYADWKTPSLLSRLSIAGLKPG